MPTYDYVCEACGHEFEAFHAMSAPSLRTCPKCGRRRLVRRIGAGAGVIFKGSGFYQTDYKSPPRSEGGTGGGATKEAASEGSSSSTPSSKEPASNATPAEAPSGGKGGGKGKGKGKA